MPVDRCSSFYFLSVNCYRRAPLALSLYIIVKMENLLLTLVALTMDCTSFCLRLNIGPSVRPLVLFLLTTNIFCFSHIHR